MITAIEDFFTKGCGRCDRFATPDCSTRHWQKGLADLRQICLEAGLDETVKWGHPCYMHQDRNIVIIGAFRDDFRLTFMNPALLKDPDGILEKQGPNTRHPNMIRFADQGQPALMKDVILSCLKEAMGYAAAGIRPPKDDSEIELPLELVDALDADPVLAEAFRNLTPGRQRSYVINLASTRKSETRMNRIARFRPHILAGKGALER